MIQQLNGLFFIRVALAMTFLSHALHGIVKNDVGLFGTEFLDKVGFAPLGWYIAWLVILFQIIGSVFLLLDKFTKWVSLGLGLILIAGIILLHAPEGWYVVGAGRNGMEFSVVLLLCLLAVSFPNALYIPKSNESKE